MSLNKKRDYFRSEETFFISWSTIIGMMMFAAILISLIRILRQNTTIHTLTTQVAVLEDSSPSRCHVWLMDPSASDQLLNSGAIQLKLK